MFLNKACHDFEKSVTPPPLISNVRACLYATLHCKTALNATNTLLFSKRYHFKAIQF